MLYNNNNAECIIDFGSMHTVHIYHLPWLYHQHLNMDRDGIYSQSPLATSQPLSRAQIGTNFNTDTHIRAYTHTTPLILCFVVGNKAKRMCSGVH